MKNKFENFKKQLYSKGTDKRLLVESLKNLASFEEQKYILKRLPKLFDNLVYGNLFVKKVEDFGNKKLGYYETVEIEINWLVHQFIKYSEEINSFIQAKQEFENSFLLGNYEKSAILLQNIKNISLSYWGLENKFLLKQYSEGLEYNFKLLNFCKQLEINEPGFYFLIHFFSSKVEDDMSFLNYDSSLDTFTSRDISLDYAEYFRFRLNPINYQYKDFGSVLWASNKLPIFDKYLVFRHAVIYKEIYRPQDYKSESFESHCSELFKVIDDDLICKALSLNNLSIIDKKNEKAEQLKIIDCFTKGDYQFVIDSSKTLLEVNPSFSVIELYVKSHIHLKININRISSENCILDNIIELVYQYFLRDEKSNEVLLELITLALSISSFDISKEIMSFVQINFENPTNEINHHSVTLRYLFTCFFNPINHTVFNSFEKQKEYLKILSKDNSLTVKFFETLLENKINLDEAFKNKIPNYRIKFYRAKYLFNIGQYNVCKEELVELLPLLEVNYLKEHCINLLFECYFNLSHLDDAVNLYVESFLSNSTITSKIEAKKIAQKIYKNNWKYISVDNINLSIFMYLVYDETHPKYISYDLYMRSLGINYPKELIKDNVVPSKAQIFFLRYIANQKIISRKVTVFKNSNAVLLERISICQILAKIDSSKAIEYNKEIAEITKRITVQARIKEIDQSKIYVDENGILASELGEVKKGFNRYRSISELLQLNNIDAKGISYEALYNLLKGNIDTDTYKKSVRKTDLQYEIFVQLYKDIRDKFLFSNQYGLDYYLSQRIRHGTIINQLRKSFKAYNLVTTKSTENGMYIDNQFWASIKTELPTNQQAIFEERLASFSSSIDEIINDIKDNYIQIKTEDIKTKQTGWFDYMYIPEWDDSWLYRLFTSEKLRSELEFEAFVKLIIDVLWKFTEVNLNKIRANINYNTKGNLISQLDKLESDLKEILPVRSANSIYKSIADCRTNVQSDVDYVISWFNKSKNDEIDFYAEDALNTSLTIVNNINSPAKLNLTQKTNEQFLIKGMYFPHFVDLIKIFLTNIHDYYKNNDLLNKSSSVNMNKENDIFIISFENKLIPDEDIQLLNEKINRIQIDLTKTDLKSIRGEGNTGFSKAYNILKNVFRDDTNHIAFDVTEDVFRVKCFISLSNLLK